MEAQVRSFSRLSIGYSRRTHSGSKPRRVRCTITAPRRLTSAEVDLADALLGRIEGRP